MRLSPLHDLQDELDRLYEQWPANDRPLLPPSASTWMNATTPARGCWQKTRRRADDVPSPSRLAARSPLKGSE